MISGILTGIALAADRDVIIGFNKPVGPSENALIHSHSGIVKKSFHLIPAIAARVPEDNITKIKRDTRVAYIEDDITFKIADEYTNSWGVQYIGSQPVHNQNINGTGVKIAVLDTGIDYSHEDLKSNFKGGYDFVNNDPDPWDDNCLSVFKTCHGTHVSGIIAAGHNDIGVVGVAPNASIYAIKVLDGGGFGAASLVVSGIEWSVSNGINIISMSLESTENSTAVLNAVDAAYNSGVLLVAAAGNTKGGPVSYPAAYDSVIAVTAIDGNDQRASFSPNNSTKIELAAPGVNINSTISGGYGIRNGTSMAAPHVTGVAALIFQSNLTDINGDGKADNKDVRALLQNTAKDRGYPGKDNTYGYGLVDAGKAVLGIGLTPEPPAEEPFIINLTLIRTKGLPINDARNVSLSQGNYSIKIQNINLSSLQKIVLENGTIQLNQSSIYKFNSPKEKDEEYLYVKNKLDVVFIPSGKERSVAYVTIRRVE